MSLLGSIFGGGDNDNKKSKKKENKSLTGLFDPSSAEQLPETPHHAPLPPRKRKEEKESSGKQPRKQQRTKKEREEQEAKAAEEEHDTNKADEDADAGDDESKETSTEEERTIFVGNLPLATTSRKSLTSMFKDCGPIASTRIRGVPVKGVKLPPNRAGDHNLMKKVCVNTKLVDESMKQTVQGYVVFKQLKSVPSALAKNNTVVEGHRIRVDQATPTVDPSRSVFCGNLPYGAEESSLQAHFEHGCDLEAGDVEGVRIIRDKETFQCKGFGYVLLKEKSMVPLALKLHETVYMKKPLRVLVCGKRFKGKKGDSVPKYKSVQPQDPVTAGAFRRMIAKQAKESAEFQKRKRGEKKKSVKKAAAGGLSRRAALEKKVDKRVKKLQKRASKGMGKARR